MDVTDKLRKLLALAQSSNPNEAALAAARAQELMVKYAIDEAAVVGGPKVDDTLAVEAIEPVSKRAPIPHWQPSLAEAMSRAFFCRVYYTPGAAIYMVGRKIDREVFRATFLSIRDAISRMADAAWEHERASHAARFAANGKTHPQALGGYAIKWKRGFHHGAVRTVHERLSASMKKLVADNTGTAIVLANRQKPVDDMLATIKLGKAGHASPVSATGYAQGKQAGWTLNLEKRAAASHALKGVTS